MPQPVEPVADLGAITYSSMISSGLIALVVAMVVAAVLGWITGAVPCARCGHRRGRATGSRPRAAHENPAGRAHL